MLSTEAAFPCGLIPRLFPNDEFTKIEDSVGDSLKIDNLEIFDKSEKLIFKNTTSIEK